MPTGLSTSVPKAARKVAASLLKARRSRSRETRSPTPGRPWRRISIQTAGPRSNPRYLRHSRQRRLPITNFSVVSRFNHEGPRRKPLRIQPLCNFVSFVVHEIRTELALPATSLTHQPVVLFHV